MIDSALLHQLQTDQGREALAEAERQSPTDPRFLSIVQQLSRRYPEPLAKVAVEQSILRRRAAAKFSRAGEMFFERQALEQASTEMVSVYRAGRMAEFTLIYDLGCGIGGDSLALAKSASVVSIDRDRMRLVLLAANALALGLAGNVHPVQGDLTSRAWRFLPHTAAFFDPSRRKSGHRIFSVNRYEPPLDFAYTWLGELEALAVKASPGVDLQELRRFPCQVEFVSCYGDLKEACLWFGSLRSGGHRATVLPGPHSLIASDEHMPAVVPPRAFLFEPDPAVMRAGLVGVLGARLGASQIDPTIAYLTSDVLVDSPFARAYRVVEILPSNLRILRSALRARGVGSLTLKKRGSAIDVETYIRRLHLQGANKATLILTRAAGRKVALLVEALGDSGSSREGESPPFQPG